MFSLTQPTSLSHLMKCFIWLCKNYTNQSHRAKLLFAILEILKMMLRRVCYMSGFEKKIHLANLRCFYKAINFIT